MRITERTKQNYSKGSNWRPPKLHRRSTKKWQKLLTNLWTEIVKRRQKTRRPHWNVKLHMIWKSMERERKRMKKTGLAAEPLVIEENRARLHTDIRRQRR